MALRKIAEGTRGTLVVYHYSAEFDKLLKEAAEGFTIYNETFEAFKGLYEKPSDVSSLPKPLYLAGFSEGCQGVRAQLLKRILPEGVIAADGIHSSTGVKEGSADWTHQIEPWAELTKEALAARTLFQVSCSSIVPSGYQSTYQTLLTFARGFMAEYSPGEVVENGTNHQHELLISKAPGQMVVRVYPGKDAAAHVLQAKVVLPQMVRDFCNPALTMIDVDLTTPVDPKKPPPPPKVPPPGGRPPGKDTGPVKPSPPGVKPPTPPLGPDTPIASSDGDGTAFGAGALALVGFMFLKGRKRLPRFLTCSRWFLMIAFL